VSYLARYSGCTHALYAYQLKQWFAWCETSGLDPLAGIQRAHVELYILQFGDRGLMDSSVVTMMHAVRGYFRFAHIDGLIGSDPAVYARLPKVHRDESRTQGLDRPELIRFLQVAQTITIHHGALAYLLGINALQRTQACALVQRRSRGLARRDLLQQFVAAVVDGLLDEAGHVVGLQVVEPFVVRQPDQRATVGRLVAAALQLRQVAAGGGLGGTGVAHEHTISDFTTNLIKHARSPSSSFIAPLVSR